VDQEDLLIVIVIRIVVLIETIGIIIEMTDIIIIDIKEFINNVL
jgi:hypothetical protein